MDQESRDANSLLSELDRGLQSQNIGEQSEAVVRFTNFFQRYPLPVLINSACLKLAEAFRCGSNFIRVQICEVFERNQVHLNKIYNVEDFYRNLFTVTTSNDPIARSITLLTLGHIAPVVSGHKSIHHCVSLSLESTVECELNAAVACAACYVKHSSEFACNIYPKIVSIIDSDKSALDLKIRALSVLDHGFYNANGAMTVRLFLINVIEKSKNRSLICSCLTLSTRIAYTSLSHITPQIELLLNIFQEDSRQVIRLNALRNLRFLAEKSPHIWDTSYVDPLVAYMERTLSNDDHSDDRNLCTIVSIFCKLLTCNCNFISQQAKTCIFAQCYKLAMNTNHMSLCSMAFELLTAMSEEQSHSSSKNMMEWHEGDLITDTFSAMKHFLNHSPPGQRSRGKNDTTSQQQVMAKSSKEIYRQMVRLCQLNPQYSTELIRLVFDRISHKDTSIKEVSPYVTELLCAVVQVTKASVLNLQSIWKVLKSKSAHMSDTNLLNLCVLYFQTLRLDSTRDYFDESFVDKVTQNRSIWFGFKVMRQAMRYGHHKLAGSMCQQLHNYVTTDTMDFYFKSLGQICLSESVLLQDQDLSSNLKAALPLYEGAISPLRASVSHSRTTNFQLQLLWLRVKMLQAHSTLRQACKLHQASPITYATLLNAIGAMRGNFDPSILRLSIVQQMPKIAKDFRYLGSCYENLSVVSFDCDYSTLDYLHLLKCSCIIMADAIDAIFQYGKNLPVISKLSLASEHKLALEHRDLEEVCNQLIEMIRTEIVKPGIFPSNKSIEPLITVLKTFSDKLLRCPFVYPRYFFQPLQMTRIKLAITPQPTQSSGCITQMINENLVLKVEGLIHNLSKTQIVIRKISKVMVSVNKTLSKGIDANFKLSFQSTTEPYNNYFKTEFLLPLKWPGSFNVDVDVSIIDEDERVWKTGPTERLNLMVTSS